MLLLLSCRCNIFVRIYYIFKCVGIAYPCIIIEVCSTIAANIIMRSLYKICGETTAEQ